MAKRVPAVSYMVFLICGMLLYSKKASFTLNCRSSLSFQKPKKVAYLSNDSLLVSFCYSSSQRASFMLNCRSSLQVQIPIKPLYQSTISLTVSFCILLLFKKSIASTQLFFYLHQLRHIRSRDSKQ